MNHEKQDGIWKDANSPAGHGFYAPIHDNSLDCPACIIGIPKMSDNPQDAWECDECGLRFTLDELRTYNRLRR